MATEDIHYKVTIETGQSGLDANVILCIFGDENTTANLALKTTKDGGEAKFEKDSTVEFDLEAIDVGKIKKINIGHDGKGEEQQWFLKTIKIEMKNEHYIFKADRWLSEEKDDHKTYIDLLPEQEEEEKKPTPVPKKPQARYAITIVTSSEKDAGTDSGVSMTIYGDKENTEQFRLTETKQGKEPTFNSDQTTEFEMDLDDVGQITKINIGQDGKGLDPAWRLATVQIQKGSDTYKFIANKVLDDDTPYIDLTPAPKERPVSPKVAAPPVKPKETTYKIQFQTGASQQDFAADDASLYVIIVGENGKTEKIPIKAETESNKKIAFKKGDKTEFDVKTTDVGKVSKIILGQDSSDHAVVWHVDNVIVHRGTEKTTFNAEKSLGQPDDDAEMELLPSAIPPKAPVKPPEPKQKEVSYKVLVRYGAEQDSTAIDNGELYMIIFGQNGETKKIPLKKKDEIEYQTTDVGKILKILIGQDSSANKAVWHVDNVTVKRGSNETVTFNAKRSIGQSGDDAEMVLLPSAIPPKPPKETPRKTSDTISKVVGKTKDVDYEITTFTGDTTFKAAVTLRIRGDTGTISIPLTKTVKNEAPFQSNATDEFTSHTTDVGKIKRITIEHSGKDEDENWHLKKIKIKKGNDVYNFHADVHLSYKDNKANFYPIGALLGHKREDYVQTELRRLRESLRSESQKMHRPQHKAHEPFVYNDLSPYFDTTPVEKAIYAPLETPPGYYTRLTALRIVEPWEAYGMDYGVNYELLKSRRGRSASVKRANVLPTDESIDRKQGSTHLPKFPSVSMQKPAEYQRTLTMNDVSKIRSYVRTRYTANADGQLGKDYKRTRDDFYRMQLDNVAGYHESNRDNMVRVYRSYLENTPGSKKALHELCEASGINFQET